MPIDYLHDLELGVIVVTAVGTVTYDDRARFVRNILDDPSMPKSTPILIDATRVLNAPGFEDTSRIAFLLRLLNSHFQHRVAYWVTTVGLSTSFTIVTLIANETTDNFRTFSLREEALRWLKSGQDET